MLIPIMISVSINSLPPRSILAKPSTTKQWTKIYIDIYIAIFETFWSTSLYHSGRHMPNTDANLKWHDHTLWIIGFPVNMFTKLGVHIHIL